jgi:hypothetical protein
MPPKSGRDFYSIHGWLLWAAWGVAGLLQITSIRYMKIFWRFSFIIHLFAGLFMFFTTLVMAILGIKNLGWVILLDNVHCILGLVILIVVSFIVFGGIFSKYMLNCVKWRTRLTLNIKQIHAVSIIND